MIRFVLPRHEIMKLIRLSINLKVLIEFPFIVYTHTSRALLALFFVAVPV